MLIGLSGYAGTGKDEVARVLVGERGFVRAAVSDPLRRLLYAIDPAICAEVGGDLRHVSQLAGAWSYEEIKGIGDGRSFMQRLGRALRQEFGEDVLINHVLNQDPGANRVSSSIRYPNEALAVRKRGGFIVRVDRPGVGPANGDVSETALDDYDFDARIINGGDLVDLRLATLAMFEHLHSQLGVLPL